MVVPIDHLKPILDDLLTLGRVNAPPRPWLGLYAMEDPDDRVVLVGLAGDGPAQARRACGAGDMVRAVAGAPGAVARRLLPRDVGARRGRASTCRSPSSGKATFRHHRPSGDRGRYLKAGAPALRRPADARPALSDRGGPRVLVRANGP